MSSKRKRFTNLLDLEDTEEIKSKNVRKFTNRSEVYDYLEKSVFNEADFIEHVIVTAKANNVSYLLAFDLITNHLTDILYEIDKEIINKRKKVKLRVYGYFSIAIGFMITSKRKLFKQSKNKKS